MQTNATLGTVEKRSAFCRQYYDVLHRRALELTENEESAKLLTHCVLQTMCVRFANRPLPSQRSIYMKAQMALIHSECGRDAEALRKYEEEARLEDHPLKAEHASAYCVRVAYAKRKRRPKPKAAPREEELVRPAPEPEAVIIPVPAPAVQEKAPEPMQRPAPAASDNENMVFDEKKTALWKPGTPVEDSLTSSTSAWKADEEEEEDDEESGRSVKLTVFNTILGILLVAAVLFLLWEFGILPDFL